MKSITELSRVRVGTSILVGSDYNWLGLKKNGSGNVLNCESVQLEADRAGLQLEQAGE